MESYYNYFKALHIFFVVAWFAGLFYVPRLFIYHIEASKKGKANSSTMNYLNPNDSLSRDWLQQQLQDKGINTIIYYPIPIHLQPAFVQLGYKFDELPITERLCNQVLSLPIFPEISLEEQKYVAKTIKDLVQFNKLS